MSCRRLGKHQQGKQRADLRDPVVAESQMKASIRHGKIRGRRIARIIIELIKIYVGCTVRRTMRPQSCKEVIRN
eukprot:768799-Hanusia_phi.AAC.7